MEKNTIELKKTEYFLQKHTKIPNFDTKIIKIYEKKT